MAKRSRRPKASDIFHQTTYMFSSKVSFEEAFPEIEDVTVVVEETGQVPSGRGKRTYGKKSFGQYIDCSNPLCYGGGFPIGSILKEMVRNKIAEFEDLKMCEEYESSPKGKHKYQKCFNFFKIQVSIKYKEIELSESS